MELLTAAGNRMPGKVSAAGAVSGAGQKAELKKVAQEFEAVFIAQMLKVMRETIEESGLTDGGFGKSVYTELFDQETAMNMARHGTLGIADILYRSLAADAESAASSEAAHSPDAGRLSGSTTGARAPEAGDAETGANEDSDIPDFQLPVHAPLSSAFGMRRDPFTGQARFHKGIDLAAPEGMAVVPALPGKVLAAGYARGYGNAVLVEHEGGIRTRYGHLAAIHVKAGDVITSENTLGTVGSTGRSTGPHLHFEVMRMGQPVDPMMSYRSPASAGRADSSQTGG